MERYLDTCEMKWKQAAGRTEYSLIQAICLKRKTAVDTALVESLPSMCKSVGSSLSPVKRRR